MNDIYLWCVTGMAGLLTLNTLWRLWSERQRLGGEDLSDEDRAFAWRIVVFLIFPLLTFLDMRSTIVSCEWLGGYVHNWSYGLLWYHANPSGLTSVPALLMVLFAGAFVELVLSLCCMPALLFRPHPFLATVIGYTVVFTFGFNLIADPLLALAGMGSPRWQLIYALGPASQRLSILALHLTVVGTFLGLILNQQVRLWFVGLSRPKTSDDLKKALSEALSRPSSARQICRLGILYDRLGLSRQAVSQLKKLHSSHPSASYTPFLQSLLSYRKRDYRKAQESFANLADRPDMDGYLKASLLAASACAAFANNQVIQALNLAERALEFDDLCMIARLVKVDVFLRQGKKDEAGQEILYAMRSGSNLNLENKVPLDVDRAFESISRLENQQTVSSKPSMPQQVRS